MQAEGRRSPKTAGDMMRMMGVPDRPVEYIARKVVSRIPLGGETKYSFCPYCVRRMRAAGKDYKAELRPLWRVTYRVLYGYDKSHGVVAFDTLDECGVCKSRSGEPLSILVEDWERFYARPYVEQGSKMVDLGDTRALRAAGFAEYADSIGGFGF